MRTICYFCAALLLLGGISQTFAQRRDAARRDARNIEFIVPVSTNLFSRTPGRTFVVRGTNFFLGGSTNFSFGSSTNRVLGTNVVAGRTSQLNTVGLTNTGFGFGSSTTPTNSLLIGPVYPEPVTNLAPTGRASGFDGLGVGPVPAPLVTNAVPGFPTNSVTGNEVPGPAVPQTPATPPLAPPIPPSPPQPATPTFPPDPNAPPSVPGSANPAPRNVPPSAPPTTPNPGAPPAPPPAAPGGNP